MVGKTNEFAYAAARKVAESDNIPFLTRCSLYSGVGLGKTHLMHAIAWHIKQRCPEKNIVYLSAEKFMYKLSAPCATRTPPLSRNNSVRLMLMVDDVQFMGGKDLRLRKNFSTPSTP